ncbi:MAG: hypothetical protein K1X75_10585 [Leptospirales bacterium]|nr:hypothetical protein [Leptospirales bacterium]
MSAIPKPRLYLGWIKEILFCLLFLLQWPIAIFFRQRSWQGRRKESLILLGDLGASPLIYWRLAGALHRLGFTVHVYCCASILRGIGAQSREISDWLAQKGVTGGILLGHGAGALAALSLPDAGRQRIQRLITLAAPFHGSRLFLALPFVPALRDVAAGSDFLLLHRMNALLFASFDPFCAWQDQWIVPFNLALFGQGRDLIVDQVGHYNLALGAENIEVIKEFLSERYPDPGGAGQMARQSAAPSGGKDRTPAVSGKSDRQRAPRRPKPKKSVARRGARR